MKILLAAIALSLSTSAASAEVTMRDDHAFSLSFARPVTATPDEIWFAATHPRDWWSDAHTYSGSARNIRLEPTPGGCWCEDLAAGGVKHGEVVLAWPEQRMLRIEAPFGPLQSMAANAVLTMSWSDPQGDAPRMLRWTFVANGPDVGAMADAVDAVMVEQFGRLGDRLATQPSDQP